MDANTSIPLARSADLVVEEIDDEVLVYDLTSNQAHCLSATAAAVWRACDGQTSSDALVAHLGLDAEAVGRALIELASCDLLQARPVLGETRNRRFRRKSRSEVAAKSGNGLTRRETTIKFAQYGTAAMAIPLIWSIAGPIPEAAATPTPAQCLQYNDNSCDACSVIIGCCCCCQGGGECKTCYTSSLCSSFTCPPSQGGGLGKCSTSCTAGKAGCVPVGTPFNCKKAGRPAAVRPAACREPSLRRHCRRKRLNLTDRVPGPRGGHVCGTARPGQPTPGHEPGA